VTAVTIHCPSCKVRLWCSCRAKVAVQQPVDWDLAQSRPCFRLASPMPLVFPLLTSNAKVGSYDHRSAVRITPGHTWLGPAASHRRPAERPGDQHCTAAGRWAEASSNPTEHVYLWPCAVCIAKFKVSSLLNAGKERGRRAELAFIAHSQGLIRAVAINSLGGVCAKRWRHSGLPLYSIHALSCAGQARLLLATSAATHAAVQCQRRPHFSPLLYAATQ
jgi:hypothetical protein